MFVAVVSRDLRPASHGPAPMFGSPPVPNIVMAIHYEPLSRNRFVLAWPLPPALSRLQWRPRQQWIRSRCSCPRYLFESKRDRRGATNNAATSRRIFVLLQRPLWNFLDRRKKPAIPTDFLRNYQSGRPFPSNTRPASPLFLRLFNVCGAPRCAKSPLDLSNDVRPRRLKMVVPTAMH